MIGWKLTDDVEVDEVAANGLRADLALVYPRVPLLGPLDLQRPLFVVSVMVGLEALVARVGVAPHSEDVDVAVTYPRHLQHINIQVSYP